MTLGERIAEGRRRGLSQGRPWGAAERDPAGHFQMGVGQRDARGGQIDRPQPALRHAGGRSAGVEDLRPAGTPSGSREAQAHPRLRWLPWAKLALAALALALFLWNRQLLGRQDELLDRWTVDAQITDLTRQLAA